MVYTFSEHGHTIEITSPVVKVNKKISPSPAGRENHLIPTRGYNRGILLTPAHGTLFTISISLSTNYFT